VGILLSLVGAGDSQPKYEEQARRLGVQKSIRFVGYVSREEISEYYKQADVFALPSYNEGMSVAALEAMGAGLPLVITRTGGAEELVEDGVNGYSFAWGDTESLTNYLRLFAKDRALARRMGTASRVRALRFSWDVIADQFLDLFSDKRIHGSLPTQKSRFQENIAP
jgi:glycosyltransferase involved in cell wall biosynthesis